MPHCVFFALVSPSPSDNTLHELLPKPRWSSTVGRLFKGGFGRFSLGQAKPSLSDQNVLLVLSMTLRYAAMRACLPARVMGSTEQE
ncbi:hypothetical protein M8C21_024751 [Ambrosia artemisiifolia]|uniref:Uncharacterized protein n=1 Tax=Ambrosia artemisiifolia TaxID=4212 RepID=A0AAD5CUT2_AMBAR|nr:hypothetical protein M8C21_024751 [Ambrosia artemisiifolia]